MTHTRAAVLVAFGTLLVAFAALVALYAGEPFNVATPGGIAGVGLIAWAARETRRRERDRRAVR